MYSGIIGIVELVCVINVFSDEMWVLIFNVDSLLLIVFVVWFKFFFVLLMVVWL